MKRYSVLFALAFLQACSHPIEIIGEGDVASFDGDRGCTYEEYLGGTDNCEENYVVAEYHETYFATARPGWYFEHWQNYCTEDILGECFFEVSQKNVRSMWGQTAPPLVAVFAEHNGLIPESHIITADNRQWIRPRIFHRVNWSDIAALCPAGQCSGTLMGFDITGWTWASVEDLNSLFNYYIGSDELGPESSFYGVPGDEWLLPFWQDNWGHNSFLTKDFDGPWTVRNSYRTLEGLTRDCVAVEWSEEKRVPIGYVGVFTNFYFDGVDYGVYSTENFYSYSCEQTINFSGAWFYRELP